MVQQIRFATSPDGVKLAYATAGSGPPLVRVRSWLTHLELDWNSPVWEHWWHAFSRDHTFVRYDARGCGLSDRPAGNYSLETWVADLETVIDALGFERVPLLGLSRGAAVAVAYAVKHPEQVSHLVLYGGFARGRFKRGPGEETEKGLMMLRLIEHGWGEENPAFRPVHSTTNRRGRSCLTPFARSWPHRSAPPEPLRLARR